MQDVDERLKRLNYESREAYDRAKKEAEFVQKVEETMDLADGKTALKLYNKIVKEKIFSSLIGYEFLFELRDIIQQTGVADPKSLTPIPVREIIKTEKDTLNNNSIEVEKYKQLYEGQRVINKKFKIAIIACVIILIGFVVVNLRLEYSVFTYFTNYKATMEEELINKYQNWSDDLERREQALNGGDSGNGSDEETDESGVTESKNDESETDEK
ncbi:MAG: hypothetical protein J5819_02890 [Eubacterium sp.]|nr:hypothetical protein [Eubacterium sp.]